MIITSEMIYRVSISMEIEEGRPIVNSERNIHEEK